MQPASKLPTKHTSDSDAKVLDDDSIEASMSPKSQFPKDRSRSSVVVGVIFVVLVILGLGTGYMLSGDTPQGTSGAQSSSTSGLKKVVGSTDTQTFNDSAEGTVEKGGIDKEGTHKLVNRPENPTQPACLISSVLDLDEYIGKTIKVWGKTEAGKKCSWLMDVGRVEL